MSAKVLFQATDDDIRGHAAKDIYFKVSRVVVGHDDSALRREHYSYVPVSLLGCDREAHACVDHVLRVVAGSC